MSGGSRVVPGGFCAVGDCAVAVCARNASGGSGFRFGRFFCRTRWGAFSGSGESKVLVFFSGSDLLTCMLPTFCPPTIWTTSLEFYRKPSILAADDFLGACYRKAMTPKKLWTLLFLHWKNGPSGSGSGLGSWGNCSDLSGFQCAGRIGSWINLLATGKHVRRKAREHPAEYGQQLERDP